MPHVEDRSARRLKQENKALLRKQFETQMVELRHQQLMEEQQRHLASLVSDIETKDFELTEMLKRVQHQELQSAVKVASTETQAEAMIRRQTQEHTEQLRKERFRSPSPRTRTAMLKHPTTPTGTPNPTKEARKEQTTPPNISPINP